MPCHLTNVAVTTGGSGSREVLGGNLQTATLFVPVPTCYDSRADGLATPGWQMGDKCQLLSQHPAKQCQPSISCVLPSASAPARNLLEGSVGTEYAGCKWGPEGGLSQDCWQSPHSLDRPAFEQVIFCSGEPCAFLNPQQSI